MWMMGYNDGADFFAGRNKLRTIVPRPAPHAALNPPCLGRSDHHLFSFNHHLAGMTDQQRKREFNTQQQVVVSSRWNPTPEQLQTLEELYGRGTRTPSAEQIQHITAQLRRYGKIEGKNVFYWFQNHKARERQKRRRQLDSTSDEPQQQQPHNVENMDKKESGSNNGTSLEVEGTKNYASHTNSCTTTTLAGKTTDSMQRIVAKAAINPECRSADGWLQFEDSSELHQRKSPIDDDHHHKTATWHTMKFFGSSSPSPTIIHSSPSNSTLIRRSKKMKPQNLNIFFRQPNYEEEEEDRSNCESQTLQLFPLQSSSQENDQENGDEKEAEIIMNTTTTMTPQKFFEFLPLKN